MYGELISFPILYPLPFPSLLLSLLPLAPPLPPPPSPYTMQADLGNHLIRLLVLSSGVVSTLAGQARSFGSTNGIGTNARFNFPTGIALDAAGTFAVVVRGDGRGALREGMRLEGGRGMGDGVLMALLGASE